VVSRGGSHCWFRVVLHEGRNREVRRLWDSQGLLVSRLKRIRYGNIELPRGLRPGQNQPLTEDAVKDLRETAGAGPVQPTLTLKPVLHQRHTARGVTEVKPASQTPHAWTGVRHDEARELTAFDRVRPDDFPGRGKRRRGPPRGDVNGNVLRPDQPARNKRRKGRGVAPGQELPSVRTWFAGDKRPGGGQGRGAPGGGQNRGPQGRSGPGGRPNRGAAGDRSARGPRRDGGGNRGGKGPGKG
jgi:23S rRNA pseudouridine2605 synthase